MSIEAASNRSPGLASHFYSGTRTAAVSTKGGTSSEQFGSKGNRGTTENGLPSLRPCPERDLFEVLKSDNEVYVIDHIAMFLAEGTNKQGMLNQPSPDGSPDAWPRDIPSSAGQVVTGHTIFTNRPNCVGMALAGAQLGHWQVDKDAVNAGKRVDGTIAPFVLPREAGLGNFNRAGESGKEGSSAAGVTIAEGLAARVESYLIQIANVEVANEEPIPSGYVGQWAAAARSR